MRLRPCYDLFVRRLPMRPALTWFRNEQVRDKLLGKSNDDIDIAIDTMSGVEFAENIRLHLEGERGAAVKVCVIKANPDQSKHLETATMKVCGFEIDVVNLRTETYHGDSRIPVTTLGTATEDAHRRDFTINSLFYNIHTGLVEDYTGAGVSDLLTRHLIRTPLPPKETFLDDPLRILRAVRFAVRFGYRISDNIIEAAADTETRAALSVKVSRERIGKEVEGMLSGRCANFPEALQQFVDMRLCDIIFASGPGIPGSAEHTPVELPTEEWQRAVVVARWVKWLVEAAVLFSKRPFTTPISPMGDVTTFDASENASLPVLNLRIALLASAHVLFAGQRAPVSHKKGREQALATKVILESLKLKTKDGQDVALLVDHLETMRTFVDRVQSTGTVEADPSLRLDLGLFLRKVKGLWRELLALSCAMQLSMQVSGRHASVDAYMIAAEIFGYSQRHGVSKDATPSLVRLFYRVQHVTQSRLPVGLGDDGFIHEAGACITNVVDGYRKLVDIVDALGLDGVWSLKPLMKGKELADRLGLPNGPAIGKMMEEQVKWQLQHPCGTAEECASHLESL